MPNKIILKPNRDKPVRQKHPWIFSGAIERYDAASQDGDLVEVLSSQGEFLARGYLNRPSETAAKFGDEQVLIWRRAYAIAPPALEEGDERLTLDDPRYAGLPKGKFPRTECLQDTVARAVPYWETVIVPQILAGKQILIAAHGNSIRAMIKYLDNVSDDDIVGLNIPTAQPLVYELDENCKPIRNYYLADPAAIAAAQAAVAAQGKARA